MGRHLITSALPYINGVKHLGNLVGSMLPADVYARYQRLRGHEVLFICATDEHGTPAELAAAAAGLSVADYCAEQHEIQADLARTKAAIQAAAPGAEVPFFRAPGGNFTDRLVSVLVPVAVAGTYSYGVPNGLSVAPGDIVQVPRTDRVGHVRHDRIAGLELVEVELLQEMPDEGMCRPEVHGLCHLALCDDVARGVVDRGRRVLAILDVRRAAGADDRAVHLLRDRLDCIAKDGQLDRVGQDVDRR